MKYEITKVWIDARYVYVQLADGTIGTESIADYPNLKSATPKQREKFVLDAAGIHWDALDEDLCFEGFFNKPNIPDFARKLRSIVGLNMSQIAKRIGLPQSLFAAYLCGKKTPSQARLKEIEAELHRMGQELNSIVL